MSDLTAILLTVALLAGNAFFVGAEFALISARRTQIEPLAAAGSRPARITLRGMERVSLMMAGAQLGITACSLGLGALGEPAVAHQLEKPLEAIGITGAWLHSIAFTVALLIVVFLHMVLGEMVPKNIAIAGPERSALVLGPVLYGIVWILRPLIWTLNQVANLGLRILRVTPQDEVTATFRVEEVEGYLTESHSEGLLDDVEHQLLTGTLTLSFETVRDVMLPLDTVVCLPADVTPQRAHRESTRTGFSRFPLVSDSGEWVGYLHLKDFAVVPRGGATKPVPADAVRPLTVLSPEASLEQALTAMQARGTHLAMVRTSDGEVLGAAMLEDVIERLVGEVVDVVRGA